MALLISSGNSVHYLAGHSTKSRSNDQHSLSHFLFLSLSLSLSFSFPPSVKRSACESARFFHRMHSSMIKLNKLCGKPQAWNTVMGTDVVLTYDFYSSDRLITSGRSINPKKNPAGESAQNLLNSRVFNSLFFPHFLSFSCSPPPSLS